MAKATEPSVYSGWRNLGAGAALLISGRLVSAACGLVQVPIALAHLGPERFGVWVALTAVLWTLVSFDGGIGYSFQNRIAVLLATGREPEAAAFARRGQVWLWRAAAVVTIAAGPLFIWGAWPDWLGIGTPALAGETRTGVLIVFVATLFCLPLSFAARIATAAQATWIIGWWTGLASIVGLTLVGLCAWFDLSVPAFTASTAIAAVLPHVAIGLHLRLRFAWLRRPAANPPATSGIPRESALFFVPQVGAAFIGSFVPTLVAFFAGPIAAGNYGILQRLFGLGLQLQVLSLQPTWPAYTHAAARRDPTAAIQIYRRSTVVTLAAVALGALCVVPFTRDILGWWLRENAPVVSNSFIWIIAGWHLLQCLGQPPAMVLNGTGRTAVIAGTSLLVIAVAAALFPALGSRWGTAGVIAALALPYTLLNLPVVAWQAQRALAGMKPAASRA